MMTSSPYFELKEALTYGKTQETPATAGKAPDV